MLQRISCGEAQRIIDEREPLILDVRDPRAFQDGHIRGAVQFSDQLLRDLLKRESKDRPLLVYCYHGNSSQDVVRMLSDYGFRETYSMDGGFDAWRQSYPIEMPAPVACQPQASELTEWLETHGFDPRDINLPLGAGGSSALIKACQLGLADIAEQLLQMGAEQDAVDGYGNDALWAACYSEDLRTIVVLLDAGVDLNRQNPAGSTSLMYAASSGKTEVVAFLLENGADPAIRNQDDFSALDLASNIEILNMLRKVGS